MSYKNIPIGKKAPHIVNAIIEIPKESHNKYEYDEELDIIKLDRVLHSPVYYPTDYGFIPETRSTDGDHLDIMVISPSSVFPGCLIEAKIIGVMIMEDEAGMDEKIIAISTKDPNISHVNTIDDIEQHFKNEIQHFFEVYKHLEKNKSVTIKGWDGIDTAIKIIKEAQDRYQKEAHK